MNAQKVKKWERWIDRLERDVQHLHHNRRVWRDMMHALAEHADAAFFQEHYTRLYVDASAIAVRRLAYGGSDDDSISLVRLIGELKANPSFVTADRYADRYSKTVLGADYGREMFEEEWGDGGGNLDEGRLDADSKAVTDASLLVAAFADRTIAHIDKRGFDKVVTYNDLDQAIDEIGRIFHRYRELIAGSSLMSLEPTVQGDWKAPFRTPLFGPDDI